MKPSTETNQLVLNFGATPTQRPIWVLDDGGAKAAGYTHVSTRRTAITRSRRGEKVASGDCVIRAVAIALELPYERVHRELWEHSALTSDPAVVGIYKDHYHPWLLEKGWIWTPTMHIGTGCKVHLRADELPRGRLIVQVTNHLTVVVDGVIHDTHDPTRDGTRCVYGYYRRAN